VSERVALVVVDDIANKYDFGASHPLRPERVLLTYENIRTLGLSARPNANEVSARIARDDEILAVHDEDYVDAVKGVESGAVSRGQALLFGLGTSDNPLFNGMHDASAAVAGASITAADEVVSGRAEHAFNPAGGLHHARRREASGFCIYDDPAVAIAQVLRAHPGWRVMYVDVDVHHGDGVQWIFYDDPRVLTVSLHQSGRYLYPGTGFEDEIGEGDARGTAANLPLLPFTGNDDYLYALRSLVPPLAAAFRPDVLVTQLGADTHHGDPLANLGLTMAAYPEMARLLHSVAHDVCGGRWVATGGGGYQAETVVPKVWTIYFAEMVGAPETIPPEWIEDRDPAEMSRPMREEIEKSVVQVLDACIPRLESLSSGAQ
jgi:acetoin utilization protein AcuC